MAATATDQPSSDDIDLLERGLREALSAAQLIGEIDPSDWGPRAEAALRTRVHRCDPPRLRRLWPATFATYLVYQGLEVYDEAAFWPNLSIPQLRDGTIVGPEFEAVLHSLHLATFEDLEDLEGIGRYTRGRYIRRIHLHGGIPRNAIERVVSLLASTLRAGAASASEVLDMWSGLDLQAALRSVAAVRCLRYTGEAADRLVGQLIELVRAANRQEDLFAVGAPAHLVDGVLQYADRPAETAGWNFTPGPSVRVDPHRGEPFLLVPAAAGVWWHVNGAEVGVSSLQVEQQFPLAPSTTGWEVVSDDGEEIQTRKFAPDGLSAGVIVFDERGRLLRRGATLGGARAFVVTRPSAAAGHEIDRHGLGGSWGGYDIRTIDLRSSDELVVTSGDGELRVPVVNELSPRLSRGVLRGVSTPDGREVLSGAPTLAFDGYVPDPDSLEVLTSAGVVRLSEVDRFYGEFDISGVFPDDAAIDTQIVVRWGERDVAAFDVSFLPGVEVLQPRLCAPNAEVLVVLGARDRNGTQQWQRIEVPAGLDRENVDLDVLGATHKLVVAVNRLRWELEGPHTLIPMVGGEGFSVHLPDLHDHRLLLRTGGVGVRVALRNGPVEHEEWARRDRHRPSMRVFEVRSFADTARAAAAPHLPLEVRVDGVEPIPVGVLERRYEPTSLRAAVVSVDDGSRTLEIEWTELSEWRGREVRIWGQAPDEPEMTIVPQPGQRSMSVPVGHLPDGRHMVELAVASGWTRIARPNGGRNVVPFYVGSEDAERLRDAIEGGDRRCQFRGGVLDELVPMFADLVQEQALGAPTRDQRLSLFERIADDHWRTFEVISELHDRLAEAGPSRAMNQLEGLVLDLLPMMWVHPVSSYSSDVQPVHLEHLWEIAPMLAACCDRVRRPDGLLEDECDERWRRATGFSIAPPRDLVRALDRLAEGIPGDLAYVHDPVELLKADAWRASVRGLCRDVCDRALLAELERHSGTAKRIVQRCSNGSTVPWTGVPLRVERRLASAGHRFTWLPKLVRFACELLEPSKPDEELLVSAALRAAYAASPVATRTAVIYAATSLRIREGFGPVGRLVS